MNFRLKAISVVLSWFLVHGSLFCNAQTDSVYRIGLILPFQTASTAEKLEAYTNAHDLFTANKITLDADAITAIDFYQGVIEALSEAKDTFKIELSVYDNWNNDSITTELLKKPELKKNDIIIGSVSTSSAKLVADFCKHNKIVNIQPFTPSKSLTTANPYHIKLAPTIDAHTDVMYQSIVDSFPGANVIIYTTDAERHLSVAKRFDSLLRGYNATTTDKKFTVSLLNTKDMMVGGKKTTAADLLSSTKQNILILTSFDESFVNGNLRVLHDKLAKDSTIIVYGLPTWLNGDVLRLDYVNDFHTRISDYFNEQQAIIKQAPFIKQYTDRFNTAPARFAYLGYDVTNFLLYNLEEYGKGFTDFLATQHYTGTAYKFDIAKNMKDKTTLNYYENVSVNVFMVDSYLLKRVW